MIPGPYESNRGFVRSFMHLGPSKHSFQGGFFVQHWSIFSGLLVIFRRGWALFTLDIRIGIAIAGSALPYLDCIVAAEEVNGREGK
jgi:hypothetical protein